MKSDIAIMFRWPRLPSIILSPDGLTAALDRKQLVAVLKNMPQSDSLWEVKVIDLAGWEFWFDTQHRILAPGLAVKKWTKRKLIELYNDSRANGQDSYNLRSVHNYRLEKVVENIARLLITPDTKTHRAGTIGR